MIDLVLVGIGCLFAGASIGVSIMGVVSARSYDRGYHNGACHVLTTRDEDRKRALDNAMVAECKLAQIHAIAGGEE